MSPQQLPRLLAKHKELHIIIHVTDLGIRFPVGKNRELSDSTVDQLLKLFDLVLVHDPLLVGGPKHGTAPTIDHVLLPATTLPKHFPEGLQH